MIFLLLAAIHVLLIHATIRREERFLAAHYDDVYRDYCARTGRYLTWQEAEEEKG